MPFATTTEGVPRADSLQGPSATLIYDDWYPALRADRLRGKKLATAMLLGIPLVLGRRGDGRVFALRDSCPHRGIPLSVGWFDGNRVTCRYHGWEFEPCSGQCQLIPSLTGNDRLDATRIYATAFPCEERDGHAWVYIPGPGSGRRTGGGLPAVPEVKKFGPRYRTAFLTADLPCNVDHGIIGLMDPAHGPFVHQAWWWRSRASIREKTKRFEPIPEGFRMSAHAPSGNSAPYTFAGRVRAAGGDDDRFCAAQPADGDHPLRGQVVFEPDHGDAGDRDDVPDRRGGGVECFLLGSPGDADGEILRREVRAPGSDHDDPAGRGAETQSQPDAD